MESTKFIRRDFTKVVAGALGSTLLGAALPFQGEKGNRKNVALHVGTDYHCVKCNPSLSWDERQTAWTTKQNFEYHERCGVNHFTAIMNGSWDAGLMKQWKDDCDKAGKTWEAIRMDSSYIYLPPGPERDRKIDEIKANVQKASAVGVKVITMHWTLIPIRRNNHTSGRGGSSYHSFKLEPNWNELPVESHGTVNYNDYWERITYFLKRVIPACEKYDVRLAVHPYDPPGLPMGYQGVDTWDAAPATVLESLKRYEAIVDSPYNGFQLCLGTVMEGLSNPRTELAEVVRYFAQKGKIYHIHMRNIRGGLHNFQEVYIDEGEANFIEIMRILRDTGYAWSICPDHVPTHPDDPGGYEAFAQAFGYIRGLIDSANSEA